MRCCFAKLDEVSHIIAEQYLFLSELQVIVASVVVVFVKSEKNFFPPFQRTASIPTLTMQLATETFRLPGKNLYAPSLISIEYNL